MIRLAIDTSTLTLAIALSVDERVVATRTTWKKRGHSTILADGVASMLERQNLSVRDVHELVIGSGPGSFTGLRVGLAFAKGVAFATGAQLRPIPSFVGRAGLAPPGSVMACAIDARRSEVYGAVLSTGDSAEFIVESNTWSPEAFAAVLDEQAPQVLICGNGFSAYPEILGVAAARHCRLPTMWDAPNAAGLLIAARRSSYPALGVDEVEPMYIRPSEAEIGARKREEELKPDPPG